MLSRIAVRSSPCSHQVDLRLILLSFPFILEQFECQRRFIWLFDEIAVSWKRPQLTSGGLRRYAACLDGAHSALTVARPRSVCTNAASNPEQQSHHLPLNHSWRQVCAVGLLRRIIFQRRDKFCFDVAAKHLRGPGQLYKAEPGWICDGGPRVLPLVIRNGRRLHSLPLARRRGRSL